MNYINITVRGKIARAEGRARIVCGNSDYTVRFDFDEEWAEYFVKTARFVTEDGSYTDVQFEGDTCTIPILRNTRTLLVGVFAGNLRTTTAALIHAVPCITDPDGTPADPTPDVYAQLMERFDKIEAPAAVLYTAQELTDEQKATARENIGVATPDWDQNDATAADYIKNRPFYDATIALPKELITDVQDFVEYRLQPYVGKEFFDHLADYTVRYNSVDYKFDTAKSITFSGATFIGVGCHPIKTAACSPLTSSDVPFAIFRAAASPSVVWDNEPAFIDIHNIIDGNKDIEIFHTNVKQLDRKYIPDNRFIVTATADNNSNPTADKTFTEIKAAYDAGRTVVMGTPAGLAPLSEISDDGAVFRINLSRGLGVGSFGEFYMYPDNTIEMSDPVRIPFPSATEPSAPGTASVGASNNYARADHVHPRELPEYSDADAGKVLTVAGKANVQWQLPSAGADVSLNMTGATVGQIAKITAVDDSGKPTAWEAVDMPSEGGEQWEMIAEIDFDVDAANDVSVWEYQNLPNYKELAYRKVSLTGSTETSSGISISINGSRQLHSGIGYSKNGEQSNGWGKILLLPFGWVHVYSGSANSPTNHVGAGAQTIYNAIPFDGDSITSVRLSSHPTYKIAGGKLSLYGRR